VKKTAYELDVLCCLYRVLRTSHQRVLQWRYRQPVMTQCDSVHPRSYTHFSSLTYLRTCLLT